jgi:uncharacterized protein YrzB (UPF0473 family)
MDESKMLKVTDENGKEITYEILSAFQFKDKNYVVYTDNTYNKKGELNIYASIYYPFDDTRLDPIETDEEWKAVEMVIESLKQE